MAVRNQYSYEKRQKELAKKKKKEEKIRRRTEKKNQAEDGTDPETGPPEQECSHSRKKPKNTDYLEKSYKGWILT